MNHSEMQIISRFSDLDSQMHINNSAYLNYFREAQYNIFRQKGFGFDYLLKNKIKIQPQNAIIKFFRQQLPQTSLTIKSQYFKDFNDRLIFDQEIFNNQEHACSFQSIIISENLEILSKFPSINNQFQNYTLPEFNQKSLISRMNYRIRHIDLNAFNDCSEAVLWRLNEEARWNFFSEAGLSFEDLIKNDMSLFWIEGAYNYFSEVYLNDYLDINTWISKLDKARIYISQEIISDSRRILLSEGQFLTVSLSRSKPLRIPENILKAFLPYTENSVDKKS